MPVAMLNAADRCNEGRGRARAMLRQVNVNASKDSATQHTIIDLCSGSGGPLPFVQRKLHQQGIHTRIILTDLVPNPGSFQRIKEENGHLLKAGDCELDYISESIDATNCKEQGIRTIFGAFHHFLSAANRCAATCCARC
jgi:hypothetical protein